MLKDIKTAIKIVPGEETSCKRGEEYAILLYSEKKDNYLLNIGYLGEQLDLYLAFLDIGALWFGIGKPQNDTYDNLDFVIMIGIAKQENDAFRKDMFKSKRKDLEEIWIGEKIENVTEIIRFAPSACNTQPWIAERIGNSLNIYRYKEEGKRGIMPSAKVVYYNRIDIGIFLLFLDLCLENEKINYDKKILIDNGSDSTEKTLVAVYNLK